jgi:S1-C subfamily serine protease
MFAPFFLAVSLLGPLSPQDQAAVETAKNVAVQVRADISDTFDASKDESICSGTIVGIDRFRNDIIVVTARHCVDGSADDVSITPTHVALENGAVLAVDKSYYSSAVDLGFIEASIPATAWRYDFPTAQFSDDEVQQGEGVFFYGMPAGTPWFLQFARGAQGPMFNSSPGANTDNGAGPLFALDCAACGPGDSGAGVFDNTGRLKGVLTMGRAQPEMVLYVPLAIVKFAYTTFLHTR